MKEMGKNLVKLISKPILSLRFEIYLVLGLTKSCADQARSGRLRKKGARKRKREDMIFLHTGGDITTSVTHSHEILLWEKFQDKEQELFCVAWGLINFLDEPLAPCL